MTRHLFSLAILAVLVAAPAHAQDVTAAEQNAMPSQMTALASAKNLYASASYEAALLQLSSNDLKEDVDQVDTYRALCLLALDRQSDAEETLEGLLNRQPLYAISDSEYSPRLVSIFKDVRKRVLPNAAIQLYTAGKSDYEAKNYAPAAAKFKQLMSVLGDPDVADPTGHLSDLRELADGFLKLSEQKLAAIPLPPAVAAAATVQPAPLAPPAPGTGPTPAATAPTTANTAAPPPRIAPAPAATAVAPSPVAARAYTAVDMGVEQPIIVQQALPAWRAPAQSQFLRNRPYSGRIEVLIDERGVVEKATLVKSVWPTYDSVLLQAAKNWSYRPAQKDGKPVKFVKIIDVTVNTGDTR